VSTQLRTEFTPVETESSTLALLEYLNCIPYVKASSVVEAGSLEALARGSSQSIGCSIKNIVENQTKRNIAMLRWLGKQFFSFIKSG